MAKAVWKPQGWTPLKAVSEFKKKKPQYKNVKVSYAGRLDPMAEGVLLLLIGEENKERNIYEKLRKTYETEVVLGIATDSFDALGIIYSIVPGSFPTRGDIEECLNKFVGKQKQKYPPYSSKTVNGKSLIWWTKSNKLSEIKIPEKEIEIYSIKLLERSMIEAPDLYKIVKEKISNVEGNFRQEKILDEWEKFLKIYKDKKFLKIRIKTSCSSGTYIRQLANDIGEALKGAFALSITRTSVGKFTKEEAVDFQMQAW
jgi:tRNA pseudouridine55 synthase